MTEGQVQELLLESEGTALDFKRDQYAFVNVDAEQKAALLKDILAFANSFRRVEAVILIGVEELRDGRRSVVGVTDHLDDASLQQFVNSKTNRPIEFAYESFTVHGKSVGAIRIPVQRRPFFLKRPFGGIASEDVLYRQGSSNAVANPDIIARMAVVDATIAEERVPHLELSMCDPSTRDRLDCPITIERDWFDPHLREDFSEYCSRGPFGLHVANLVNRDYWREVADWIRSRRMSVAVLWSVRNMGTVAAKNVVVTVTGNLAIGEEVFDDLPEEPDRSVPSMCFSPSALITRAGTPRVTVERFSQRWEVVAHIGDVQPGTLRWASDPVYLAWRDSGPRMLPAMLSADNLPKPQVVEFALDLRINKCPALTQEAVSKWVAKITAGRE